MNEPPSGASRIVALPRTLIDQPAGATKVFPATVVFAASAVRCSGALANAPGAVTRRARARTRTWTWARMGRLLEWFGPQPISAGRTAMTLHPSPGVRDFPRIVGEPAKIPGVSGRIAH